jgi:hypothetical protein
LTSSSSSAPWSSHLDVVVLRRDRALFGGLLHRVFGEIELHPQERLIPQRSQHEGEHVT